MSRLQRLFLAAACLVLLGVAARPAPASKVSISSLPVMSSSVLVADDTTQYAVTLTASGVAGYNDLRSIRILFDFTWSGGDTTKGRGYLAWGQADTDINNYGGTWVFADATGGGRWAYETDPWASTTYITPIGCAMTTGGSATGATGTRTITFTFTVKPAWANNPLLNKANCYAMTANDGPDDSDFCKVGWLDNPTDFAVVSAPCTQTAATPQAPVVGNPTPTTLDLAINPADSDTDLFAIHISPAVQDPVAGGLGYEYVQLDGKLGWLPAWQTKAAWSGKTVSGLSSSTSYSFTARAWNTAPGTCPSPAGPGTVGTTTLRSRPIDCSAAGIAINKGVHGMDAQTKMVSTASNTFTLDVSRNTSMRFGGDGYMWKTCTAQWGANSDTTLKYLRYARDRNSYLQILTNTRGIGTGNDSETNNSWVYTDQTPQTLAAMTADWVYYCNVLVQTKRQGDVLTADEQALLDSLSWGTNDKLLAPGEAAVPKVTWWEIGNEPEGPYPPPALTPADYASRYNIISAAMIAKDPTIKIGPGCMTANNGGNAWLDAVFANKSNRVDLVAYHPYGNLYGITRDNTGGALDAAFIQRGLNVQKSAQLTAKQNIVNRLVANNRPANTPLIISEWNTSSWQGTYYYNLGQTIAQGLGTAEDIFSFIEMGIVASQYWDQPNIPNKAGLEVPCFKVFKALQTYLPDTVVDSLVDGNFRLYTTKDSRYQSLVVWAINMSETDDKPVRIQLQNLPSSVTVASITRKTLAAYTGQTSLLTRSSTTEVAGWTDTDLTGQINPSDFTLTFGRATMTILIFDLNYLVNAPIVLDNTSFAHTAYVGTALPDDTLTISSGGPDTLNYTLTSSASWLTVSPATGAATSSGVPITLHYDAEHLAPGNHPVTITVSSNEAYNSPQVVNVAVTTTTSVMDRDSDGDIDLEDFGQFQVCLSGTSIAQNNSACAWAKLKGHTYVDQQDMTRFLGCLTGATIPPSPSCAN